MRATNSVIFSLSCPYFSPGIKFFLGWLWKCPHSSWKTPPLTGRGTVWLCGHKTMTREANRPTSILIKRLELSTSKSTTCLRSQHWDEMELRFRSSSVRSARPTRLSFIQFLFQLEGNSGPAFLFLQITVSMTKVFWSNKNICSLVKTNNNLQPKLPLNKEIFLSRRQRSNQRNSFAKTYIQFALPNSTFIRLV